MMSDVICPKLKDVVEELHDVKSKWRVIGIQLELPLSALHHIESKHNEDPDQAFMEMVQEWLRTKKDPSWSDIAGALRSVGERRLAANLQLNKCSVDDRDDVLSAEDPWYDENLSDNFSMYHDHKIDEVPQEVVESIRHLAQCFNALRLNTFYHIRSLEEAQKVTPGEFRVVLCNPERYWVGNDHRRICLADSVSDLFTIISEKKYLNWQNYDLLEEIINIYGNTTLKAKLEEYCQQVRDFENTTPLSNVKNIIFTPLGPTRYLMKVPIPREVTEPSLTHLRKIKTKFTSMHIPSAVHHVGQNSPLAIYFVVPQECVKLISFLHANDYGEKEENGIICTLSKQNVLRLLYDAPGASLEPIRVEIFEEEILHKGSTTVVCKGKFNGVLCAAKYIHRNLAASSDNWQKDQFRRGCEFLRSCQHPNIIMFLGLELGHALAPVLLTELMDESLKEFLERSPEEIPLHVQIDICTDVAHGLQHVHSKGCIYGDLNVSNILLQGGRAKIGGLMSLIHKSSEKDRSFPPGSPQCMPMQSFKFPYSELLDCFSFGILALHVAIREPPLPCCTSGEFESMTEAKRFESSLRQVRCSHPLHSIILDCLKDEEAERPTVAALTTQLSVLKTIPQYTLTGQSSEEQIESMKSKIQTLEREKNRTTIDFKTKEQKLCQKLHRRRLSVKALVSEKDAEVQSLHKELDTRAAGYQEREETLTRRMNEISATADLGLSAMNFLYQVVHQACETAKHKAQCLSDKEKEAMKKIKVVEEAKAISEREVESLAKQLEELHIEKRKEKAQMEMKLRETNKTIIAMRQQRLSVDEQVAKLYDRAESVGVELPD